MIESLAAMVIRAQLGDYGFFIFKLISRVWHSADKYCVSFHF